VLHAAQVGDEHREAEADPAADAVLQPQRGSLDVGAGALLRRRQRAGQPARAAAHQLVDPAAPLGRGRQVDVRTDLRRHEAQLLRAEARVKCGNDIARRAGRRRADRQLRGRRALELGELRAQLGQRGVERVGRPPGRVEQVGTFLEHLRDRALHRADALVTGLAGRRRSRLQDDRVEPAHLVDEPDDRPGRGAQPGRSIRRCEEHRVQGLDGRVGPRDDRPALLLGRARVAADDIRHLGPQSGGQRPAGGDRRAAHRIAGRRRPQQRDGQQGGR
jgi:hypothetical protein